MGVSHVLKWENPGLQCGSLDFSHYWFPSPVRQENRSVGFRHGGPPSQAPHSPPGKHAALQLAKLLPTEALRTHLNFSVSLHRVSRSLLLYFTASSILSPVSLCQCPLTRAWVFGEASLEAAEKHYEWNVDNNPIGELEREESKEMEGGKKERKGRFYLGESHLYKLQRAAIKELKLPNCWSPQQQRAWSKQWAAQQWSEGRLRAGEEATGRRMQMRREELTSKWWSLYRPYNTNRSIG